MLPFNQPIGKKRKVNKMKKNGKKFLILGIMLLGMFVVWTWLIQCVDVQRAGGKWYRDRICNI